MSVQRNGRVDARRGLTLIELIVVLVILIALAGVVIPVLPNMLGRAHTASGATNTAEVNKIVQTYEQLYQSFPNNLDNLCGASAIITYLPNGASQVTAGNLTDGQVAALANAGITRLATLADNIAGLPSGGSPTFNPYTGSAALTKTLKVSLITEAAIEGATGLVKEDPDAANTFGDVYVVFGFGKQSTATGKVISDPPVHFSDSAADSPNTVYSRVGLVFRVARGTGPTGTPASSDLDRAVFVGAVSFHSDGIITGDGHLAEYYNIAK